MNRDPIRPKLRELAKAQKAIAEAKNRLLSEAERMERAIAKKGIEMATGELTDIRFLAAELAQMEKMYSHVFDEEEVPPDS